MGEPVTMTNEQLHALIEAVRLAATNAAGNAAAAGGADAQGAKIKGSFAACTHNFDKLYGINFIHKQFMTSHKNSV